MWRAEGCGGEAVHTPPPRRPPADARGSVRLCLTDRPWATSRP